MASVNEARRAALEIYFHRVAREMGLAEWEIYVTPTPPDRECVLMVETRPVVAYARVFVGTFFDTTGEYRNSPSEQRTAVVHELIHVHQARLHGWLREGVLSSHMGVVTADMLAEFIREDLEIQADRLAKIISRYMPPVPEWPEE